MQLFIANLVLEATADIQAR